MSMSPARQPLHILRKDATHLWPETLVSIALLAAFAWAISQTWVPSMDGFNPAAFSAGILRLLIPVSWLVLVSRLVHDEELVGDRQFWTTRPYTWYSLLLSKVLYLVLFVGIPFLIMQAWLLHHAGLYPTLAVPGLLKSQLFIATTFLLPLLAVAVVTATFVRFASSALGGLIYAFVVILVTAYNFSDRLDAPYISETLSIIVIIGIVAAILIQYARRKTAIARIILAALPLLFVVVALLAPLDLLTNHRYPAGTTFGKLAFDSDPAGKSQDGRLYVFEKKVSIDIPVTATLNSIPDKSYLEVQRVRAVIDGPSGFHYASNWTATRTYFNQQQKVFEVPITLPEKIYNQVHDKTLSMHIDLGVQHFYPGAAYNITATETPFPIPGHANCTVSAEHGTLECRFPFANPQLIQVSATVHNGDCLTPGPATALAMGRLEPSPIAFGFNPVEIGMAQLGFGQQKVNICPGTTATFTPMLEGSHGRMQFDIPSITLDPYARRIRVQPLAPPPSPKQ